MPILLAIVLGGAFLGALIGALLAQRLARPKFTAAVLFFSFVIVAGTFAYISTFYPGPPARYIDNPRAQEVRNLVGLAEIVWYAAPLFFAAALGMWRTGLEARNLRFLFVLSTAAYSLLLSPIWIFGASIHWANFAGAWF